MSQSFGVMLALGFAGILSAMLIAVAALRAWVGELGLISADAVWPICLPPDGQAQDHP